MATVAQRDMRPKYVQLDTLHEQWSDGEKREATGLLSPVKDGVSIDPQGVMRLPSHPDGPLALNEAHGSLGALVLPRGMCQDEQGTLYILDIDPKWSCSSEVSRSPEWSSPFSRTGGPCLRRYDPWDRKFHALLCATEDEPWPFRDPSGLAVCGDWLYVTDPAAATVFVFHLPSDTLVERLGPEHLGDRDGVREHGSRPEVWKPVDVVAAGCSAYILDENEARVYRHQPRSPHLVKMFDFNTDVREAFGNGEAQRWSRIAADLSRRLYLLRALGSHCIGAQCLNGVDIFEWTGEAEWTGDCAGAHSCIGTGNEEESSYCYEKTAFDSGELRSRFDDPAVILDHKERFCLAGYQGTSCGRPSHDPGPRPGNPLYLCRRGLAEQDRGRIFNRYGEPLEEVDETESWPHHLYETKGRWQAKLDSQIYNCQWHRIEFEFSQLEPGGVIEVFTYTKPVGAADPSLDPIDERLWQSHGLITASEDGAWESKDRPATPIMRDLLIMSPKGQVLFLEIRFSSDGHVTPELKWVRVHYPRMSYLEFLPAIYSENETSRRFLEQFLSIIQTEWDDLEARIENVANYFDADTIGREDEDAIAYLASWLAVPLEGVWDFEQKRRLVSAAPKYLKQRGTVKGVREHLAAYLRSMSGEEWNEKAGWSFPIVVEGFRQRRVATLGDSQNAEAAGPGDVVLGETTGEELWSADEAARMQLGVYSLTGKARLVGAGDPGLDVFNEHAHRFQVFAPSVWVEDDRAERMLHRAIAEEAPAHTCHELCLIEPRFQVGVQSTVGVDMIIGDIPMAWLADPDEKVPPSRPGRHRLGMDTVLAGSAYDARGMTLDHEAHIGTGTQLL